MGAEPPLSPHEETIEAPHLDIAHPPPHLDSKCTLSLSHFENVSIKND